MGISINSAVFALLTVVPDTQICTMLCAKSVATYALCTGDAAKTVENGNLKLLLTVLSAESLILSDE